MFEAFLGRDNFRDGIRAYMKKYAFGNTTAEDFIGAIADANPQVDGQDLRKAFNSFIEQAGMPTLSFTTACDDSGARLEVSQKRYLPTGSTGSSDQTWLVPACINLWQDEKQQSQCFLLSDQQESIALNTETCPQAIMPNTGGSSYYRWSMNAEQWQALLQRFDSLSSGEQISVASSLSAALNDGSLPLTDYLAGVGTLATAESYRVAMAPRADLKKVHEFVLSAKEQTGLEQQLKNWYQPRLDEFEGKEDLSPDQQEFHSQLLSTLALDAKDPALRARLTEQAVAFTGFGGDQQLRAEAIDPNIRLLALLVAVEEKGAEFAQLLWQQFLSAEDALLRDHLLRGMASSIDPEVAALSRERILSSSIRDNEIFNILWYQMRNEETRQAMWDWTFSNLDAVLARIPSQNRGGLTRVFDRFCDVASADALETKFSPIIDSLESGPRHLANTVEAVRLCAAFVESQQANAGE
jgi:alanyl aminopeptidase